jgi:serine protease inhibitor
MRQWPRTLAAIGIAATVLGGCRELTAPEPQEPVRPFTATETRVAGANTAFAFGLLRQVRGSDANANILVSPLSASMALGMTLNGAAGGTFDAMSAALGFGGLANADINDAYRGLIAQLRARDPKVEFRLANSIWYRQGYAVKPPFLDAARQYFSAHVAALDFSSPAAPRTISKWAEDQTGGRIRDLVDRIDPLDRLFMVNAVYFKAPWSQPFEVAATRNGQFTRSDGSSVSAPLMRLDRALPYHMDGDVQAVELAYADSAFAMLLVAPREGKSLQRLVQDLTPERWSDLRGRLRRERVMLTVPKFRFEYSVELRQALTGLGMGVAFVPFQADFSRMADDRDLHISRVQHKTFIDVHELGTEAAAATSVVAGVTSIPPELRFDRPFLFVIHERSSGTILFLGVVEDPRS